MTATAIREIRSTVQEALASSPVYDLRTLRVECDGNAVYLRGRVATFYHKQLAQELVRSAAQGLQIVNRVDVN